MGTFVRYVGSPSPQSFDRRELMKHNEQFHTPFNDLKRNIQVSNDKGMLHSCHALQKSLLLCDYWTKSDFFWGGGGGRANGIHVTGCNHTNTRANILQNMQAHTHTHANVKWTLPPPLFFKTSFTSDAKKRRFAFFFFAIRKCHVMVSSD